jgi:hypothetical protein
VLLEGFAMLTLECVRELRESWLPHTTPTGLDRIVELLEKGSPLLIHGSFTRAIPMGCLATHIAWNHPRTSHLTMDAGITWLNQVAHLNPATSHVLREWDRAGTIDFEIRSELLAIIKDFRQQQRQAHMAQRACKSPVLVES